MIIFDNIMIIFDNIMIIFDTNCRISEEAENFQNTLMYYVNPTN